MGAPKSSLRHLFQGSGLGTQKAVSAVFLQARARRPLPSFGQRPCRDRRGGAGSARPTEARWRRSGLPDGSSDRTRGSPFLQQGSRGSSLPLVPVDARAPPWRRGGADPPFPRLPATIPGPTLERASSYLSRPPLISPPPDLPRARLRFPLSSNGAAACSLSPPDLALAVLAKREDQERRKMEGESLIGRSHMSVVMGRIWGPSFGCYC
jgi:hypothetical protein